MGRNSFTLAPGQPGVRVRNVRGNSGPKSLCLCLFLSSLKLIQISFFVVRLYIYIYMRVCVCVSLTQPQLSAVMLEETPLSSKNKLPFMIPNPTEQTAEGWVAPQNTVFSYPKLYGPTTQMPSPTRNAVLEGRIPGNRRQDPCYATRRHHTTRK